MRHAGSRFAASTTASDFDSCRGGSACTPSIASTLSTALPQASRGLLGSTALVLALIGLCIGSATALADRDYGGSIGGFTEPWGVAVDIDDNVWVSDTGNGGLISVFDPSGSPLFQRDGGGHFHYNGADIETLAISKANNYLYAAGATQAVVYVYDAAGDYVGGWGPFPPGVGAFVATDNSGGPSEGHVFVAIGAVAVGAEVRAFTQNGDPANFTASAAYIDGNRLTGTPEGTQVRAFQSMRNITVDLNGNIYVVDKGSREVDMFAPSGEFIRAFKGEGTPSGSSSALSSVAVDPTSGNVMIVDDERDAIYEFEPTGALFDEITGTTPGSTFGRLNGGIAVDSNGIVYVADTENDVVNIFGPHLVLPKVTYGPVTDPSPASGTVHATIDLNDGGDVGECRVEYGTTTAYETTTPCQPLIPPVYSTNPTDISASLAGLTMDQTYHYRVVVSNPSGTKKGLDRTYTPRAVAAVQTGPATDIGPDRATLTGSFLGDGTPTQYYFEWGATTGYGNTTPAPPGADAGSEIGSTPVSALIGGLTSVKTLHYRLVASNSTGTAYGPDRIFTTDPPNLPALGASSSSQVSHDTAVLQATINPGFGPTFFWVEYGTNTSYPIRTGSSDLIGEDGVDHTVSQTLTGLVPGTTYYFRLLATNFAGTTRGGAGTFTTADIPRIETVSASGATSTEVTLHGTFNASGSSTRAYFEYGTSAVYGSRTPESAASRADHQSHGVSTVISGLAPNTTYHFRLVAVNGVGTRIGVDQTVRTSAGPVVKRPPARKCRRGFVRRGGKCIKRKQHSKRRGNRHG